MHGVSDSGHAWSSEDFVRHYFFGNGEAVAVRETGHLRNVVAEYRRVAVDDPTVLPAQIANAARKHINRHFDYKFKRTYPMRDIVFSLGNTTIGGRFSGRCKHDLGWLEIDGSLEFYLRDEFRDPVDIGRVLNKILGEERAEFIARIDEHIADALRRVGDADPVDFVLSVITDKIGQISRSLRDHIEDRVRRLMLPRAKSAYQRGTFVPDRKDIRELPGSTIYAIVDNWSGTASAKVR